MNNKLLQSLLLIAALLSPPAAQAHGGDDHGEGKASAAGDGLMRLPDGSVQVPKPAQRRLALRTVVTATGEAAATVLLPGRVSSDPSASGQVQSAHGGRIEAGPRGLPLPGQAVRAGEVLAYVRHHAEPYARAAQQSQRDELQAARELAEKKLRRFESLEGTVPRKDIEAARIELASLTQREQSYAASLGAREALVAPVAGIVARSDLRIGAIVETREVLVEIVDPARWIVEAGSTDAGLAARIASARLQEGGAELQLLGAARSLRDGVLPLSFRLRGDQSALALNQPVSVIVQLKDRRPGVLLPAAAVVRSPANEPMVWVKTSAERFRAQPVQVQAVDGASLLVTQGLAGGERVLVQGAALVAQIR
ncbi:HlyD family efflux transporter periplasmic adaptor subunit [Pelomonas sp. SE-A7]|uniref:efflux RND transporter periplasmic adaptor subunit n=1 Tax=Pelomonas sp. SE-A7 TaxID=3054953 RepID=UPI00259C693C|nr:HlyD family efflux transporter periplasmic adaptor subunit [Pelomonas sp. SE-A7]MDM4765405.1 efflux RND transporter periplasmic adaptor subunit [Pelomonas sp. SE-A7]